MDLIGVTQKEDTDFVLLLDDYINVIYIPEIFLTTAKFDLNKNFDWRTFHIVVTRIAKKNIKKFLKFDEIIFCGILFSISGEVYFVFWVNQLKILGSSPLTNIKFDVSWKSLQLHVHCSNFHKEVGLVEL